MTLPLRYRVGTVGQGGLQGSNLADGTEAGKHGNQHKGPLPHRPPPLPDHSCCQGLEPGGSGRDLEQGSGAVLEQEHRRFGKRCWVTTVALLGTALGQSRFGSQSLIIISTTTTTVFSRAGRS